jgi:hypothetical protein
MRSPYDITRSRARRSWARRAFLRLEVLAVVIVAVCLAVLSAGQKPERIHVQLTGGGGGSLTLSNTKEGAAILSLGGMRPGDSVTDTVTLGNTGTLDGDLSLSSSNLVDAPGAGGGALSGELDLRIRDVTNAGSPVVVYNAKIAALTPTALGTLVAGDSRVYEFRVSFPDAGAGAENAYQGSTMSVQFDWTAVSTVDVDPPETTITSAPPALSASPDASFSFDSDETGSTFECSLDGGAFGACTSPASYAGLADGAHTFAVQATDSSGNTDATPANHAWTIDATAPNASLADPGAYLRGTVALNASADDGSGSGIASLVIQRAPGGGGAWTSIPANWNTTTVADGAYQLRARATDNAGNTATSTVRDVTVDNTAPSFVSAAPPDGAVLPAAAATWTITADENLADIANPEIDGSPVAGPVIAGATATFAGPFSDGPHSLAGDLVDLAGNTQPIREHFTVWSLAAADYPWVEKNSFASVDTTLAAADGIGEVFVPSGAWSGAPAGDWLVLRIDPRPAGSVPGGFQVAGDIYDVTAYWALSGTAVHTFSKSLDIDLGVAPAGAVAATLESGSWRSIAPVPSGTTLPAGWQDGYYLAGSHIHVLTKHLSSFSLLKDVQAPSKPVGFSGAKVGGHLILKWKAATDNGLVTAYLVYSKGVLVKTLSGSARSADMGVFKLSDTRAFQVAARDAAGNIGAKTKTLVVVPAVAKLTLATAKARLTARGLKAGTLSYAYSSTIATGRVISAGRSGLVAKGTPVPLKISRGAQRTTSYVPAPTPTSGSGSGGSYTPPTYYGGTSGSDGTSGTGTTGTGTSGGASGSESAASGSGGGPTLAGEGGSSGATADGGVEPQSFVPANDETSSPLRRVLGLLLLGGSFVAAGALALRAGKRPLRRAARSTAGGESLLFWDERLMHVVGSSLRRLFGRI